MKSVGIRKVTRLLPALPTIQYVFWILECRDLRILLIMLKYRVTLSVLAGKVSQFVGPRVPAKGKMSWGKWGEGVGVWLGRIFIFTVDEGVTEFNFMLFDFVS